MTTTSPTRPAIIPSLVYKDNGAALRWLQAAFGFVPSQVLTDRDGKIVHAEMTHAEGKIMVGTEWAEWTRSPASLGGKTTQRIHVRIDQGIDEHCERARKAGARIVHEPTDQFYGERSYIAADPEEHYWTFSQHVRDVTEEDMERATGFTFRRAL